MTIDYYYCPNCGYKITEQQKAESNNYDVCVCAKTIVKEFKKEYVK